MVRGVVANEVSLVCHAYNKLRIAAYEVFEDEKRSGHLLFFKNIKDFCHISVFITRIEGQIYDLTAVFFANPIAAVFGDKPEF